MDKQNDNYNNHGNVNDTTQDRVEQEETNETVQTGSNEEAPKQKGSKKKTTTIIAVVVLIVVVLLAIGVGYFWNKMNKMNQVEIAPEDIANNELSEEQTELLSGYKQIAVFGVDNRSNGNYGQGNSDTIMIVSVDNETKEVKIVSVYRDTYLRIDNDYYAKANAAYAYNGAAGGLSMLNTNFDLNMDKYVSVDWYAVVDVINLLGGVDIEISEAERQKINEYAPEVERVTGVETNTLEDAGQVHLDGVQAVAFMRIRKLAGDDYKRTQRQRIVIEATFNKLKGADLSTINEIVDEIFPMIETNLSVKDILVLAMHMGQYKIISTTGFPFEKDTKSLSGVGDCVIPITLERNVSQLHEYLFEKEVVELSDEVKQISSEIIDRTGLTFENSEIDKDSYTTGEEEVEPAVEPANN